MIGVPAWSGSDENSLTGLQMAVLLCLHMVKIDNFSHVST